MQHTQFHNSWVNLLLLLLLLLLLFSSRPTTHITFLPINNNLLLGRSEIYYTSRHIVHQII